MGVQGDSVRRDAHPGTPGPGQRGLGAAERGGIRLRGRGGGGYVHRHQNHDVHQFGTDRLRPGIPACVRLQLRCQALRAGAGGVLFLPQGGFRVPAGDGGGDVRRVHAHHALVPAGRRGCHPHRGAGAEDAVRAADRAVLYHHRQHADPVHRLQLPGHPDGHRQAGAVLHPGYLDPAGGLRDSGAPAGPAGGGFIDLYPDPGDRGDGGEGIEGDGKGGARLAPPLKPPPPQWFCLLSVFSSSRPSSFY